MKRKFITLLLASTFILGACDQSPKTEGWYVNHHDDLIKKYSECMMKHDFVSDDCVSAVKASHREADKPDVAAGVIAAKKAMLEAMRKENNHGDK